MAGASTLAEAAGQAFANLFTLWKLGGTDMKDALTTFEVDLLPVFPDSDVVSRPLASWLILIASLSVRIPVVGPGEALPYASLNAAADYVYRICWLGAKPTPQCPDITVAQQNALLLAYNTAF